MADSDLYNLEFLSLVAKITQEIDNHTGLNDKTLAEFVISLHDKANKSRPAFQAKLKEVGANFPDSFVDNVDRLILSMHPKYKKERVSAPANGKAKAVDGVLSEQERQKRLFPGLAIENKVVPPAVSDDVFLEELGDLVTGRKARPREPEVEERSPKRQRRDHSPSPSRRSPSPARGRGYGDRGFDRAAGRHGGGRIALDDKPVLFKVYNGKISGLKDFGAFVNLDGVAGRVEGWSSQFMLRKQLNIFRRHGPCIKHSIRCTRELCL
jgi:ATP-dependent RNA helicase DHX8/PRP22